MTAAEARRAAVRTAPAGAVALVALGAALWGTDAVFRKPLVDQWSSWTIVLYEHVILTSVVIWGLIRHRADLRGLTRGAWLAVLGVAWGGSALATLAFTSAFQYGNPDVVVLLQKTQPLWAIGAATLVVGEWPIKRYLLYLAPSLFGTYLLSFGWVSPGDAFTGAQGKAAALALIAAFLWGAATALGRRALQEMRPRTLTGLRFSIALPLLLAIAAWKGALAPPAGAPGADYLRLLEIALVPGLIAMLLYYRGLVRTPAAVATLAELAFPATALIVNYIFLGATLGAVQVLGLAIILVTIALLHGAPVRVEERAIGAAPAPA
jgi:drug/metabolite transporter (DMT)-like permease